MDIDDDIINQLNQWAIELAMEFIEISSSSSSESELTEKDIINQLNNKFINQPLYVDNLIEADIKTYNPRLFFADEAVPSVKEHYLLTPRYFLYGMCCRPLRKGYEGYWQVVGTPSGEIFGSFGIVGSKQKLRFYEGDEAKGRKTNWYMIEYTLLQHPCTDSCNHKRHRPDEWALCRIYHDFEPEDLIPDMKMMNI